jgi:LemA protein
MIIFILIVVAILIVACFNGMVSARQEVNEAWADIYVQLKRRHDLIPNLVEVVKSYARHEETIFEEIASARAKAMQVDQNDIVKNSAVQKEVESGLQQIVAIGESTPEIKANESFKKLMEELTNTEDEIASSRRIYNDNVASFNTKISVFPNNLFAQVCGFKPAEYFQNQG